MRHGATRDGLSDLLHFLREMEVPLIRDSGLLRPSDSETPTVRPFASASRPALASERASGQIDGQNRAARRRRPLRFGVRSSEDLSDASACIFNTS